MALRSMTMPAHNARPAQWCPPPRTDNGRPQSRAVRMANWTSTVVAQWTMARGMGPTGFAQIAVAAASRPRPASRRGQTIVRQASVVFVRFDEALALSPVEVVASRLDGEPIELMIE